MREVLEHMDGYAIVLTPFYKMEESDWVVLRLLMITNNVYMGYDFQTTEWSKAWEFLINKYGLELLDKCWNEIAEEKFND